MAENNNKSINTGSVVDLSGYVKRFSNVDKGGNAESASNRVSKSSKTGKSFTPVITSECSEKTRKSSKKSNKPKNKKAIAGNGLSSKKSCNNTGSKKQTKPKKNMKKNLDISEKPLKSKKDLKVDSIYLNESDGLYYDTAKGIALRDMFSDEEKRAYCDKKYGKGNWRKLSKSELRRMFQIEMELQEIAGLLDIDD